MNINDNELIYLYRYENSIYARNNLFERYHSFLVANTKKYVKKTYPYLPLEIEDIVALCYKNFIFSLNIYDCLQAKYSYAQALFTINRSSINAYCKSLFNNKNKMMYSSYSMDKKSELTGNLMCFADEQTPADYFLKKDSKEKSKEIISTLIKYEPALIKKVILMRAEGLKNREIALILKLTNKKVANMFNNFVKRARIQFSEKVNNY